MNYPLPVALEASGSERVEYIDSIGDIHCRALLLPKAGDFVPQHPHDYDHVTLVTAGKVRMWINAKWEEDITAFRGVLVRAHDKHCFMALEDNTMLACIHVLNDAPYKVAEG